MHTINPFTDPISGILQAFSMTFSMFWEILWALILGFTLSGIVQAVISKGEMSRLLPDASPKSIAVACGLGAASSSCSYASVALARSIFRKGGNFTAAIAFQFASTNLVIELGIILAVLMGWQFTLAEFVGGLLMIFILVFLFKVFLKPQMVKAAKQQANRGLSGKMEGHANMDMSVTEGSIWQRIFSDKGFTSISHYFVMDWASVWLDIALGLVIAGALAAWIPNDFWQAFFLTDRPIWSKLWGPIVGPIVAVFTFVCSVGNVPLAAVLWNGGISFGGVIAFIFADLIILPILNIYRKYYGLKISIFLAIAFYTAMVIAALIVEILFQFLGLIPQEHQAKVVEASIKFNYTTVLNILFLTVAALLVARFFKTGGPNMLKMMNSDSSDREHSEHHNMMHYAVTKRRRKSVRNLPI
ncbi:MAG: permease [Nostoc sp.]|uniref:permease n=1 Tax=Nostoc sp. TaxID=1180 RepID=UPI002FF59F6C